jgi:vitamin B12 transport system substrate-binding protein
MKYISIFALLITLISSNSYGYDEAKKPYKVAKRIIALAPHIVENLYAVGAGNLIVGTTEHADYPEQANNIPRIGNYARLNIEQVLAADPDLIIAWKSGNPSDDLARLEKLGLTIVYSQPNKLEDVAKELSYFGKLTGNALLGEKKSTEFLKHLASIKAHYQDKKALSVFYELWPRPLTTVANDAWPQQQLNVCQTNNPFINSETDYPQINVENVILKAPQIIIQPSSHGVNSPDNVNWQQWQDIPAVKNKAFIHPNADKLHRMTSRSLDELSLLCQKINEFRS